MQFADGFLAYLTVESSYMNTDMRKIESSQKDEIYKLIFKNLFVVSLNLSTISS